jgi:hypothetical protein
MQTLTHDLKSYLQSADSAIVSPIDIEHAEESALQSMYTVASNNRMSLQQYVTTFPKQALFLAERSVARWNDTLMEAITSGFVRSDFGKTRVNKFITDLFKLRLEQANRELQEVKQYLATTSENKGERLINVMFKQAEAGNVQAAKYLWDRLDGKIGDVKATTDEFDVYQLNIYRILHSLFDKQLQIINAGTGTKVICCSRRAGKSHVAVAAIEMAKMLTPNTKCLYISKTQKYAEKIYGAAAEQMISDLNLKDPKGNRYKWKGQLDNGSETVLRGLTNTKDPDSLRGFKFEIVIIDEFFHLSSDLLKYLQDEVLEPMQMDYADTYKMLLMGTPPKDRKSYGETVWQNTPSHNKFFWTWEDNPFISNGQAYLDKLFKDKGIDPNSAFARREYGGQWVYETDFLLYPVYYTFNPDISLPPFNISKVTFGVDYGTSDQTSIIGVAWDTDNVRGYVFYEDKFNIMSTGDKSIIQYLKESAKRAWRQALDFFPTMDWRERNKRIVWFADCNGMAQSISQELNRGVRFSEFPDLNIQIVDATRTNARIMQDKIRDLFRTSALLLPENGLTAIECELVSYMRDANGNPMSEIDHKTFHPELLTSLRYAMFDLVGRVEIGGDPIDLSSFEGIQYGGSLQIDFETTKKPSYSFGFGHDNPHKAGEEFERTKNGVRRSQSASKISREGYSPYAEETEED